MKYIIILLLAVNTACVSSAPPSENAKIAGVFMHADYHKKERLKNAKYTSIEEALANNSQNQTVKIWDTYQSGNKIITKKQAQDFLDKEHKKLMICFQKIKNHSPILNNYEKNI